MCTTVHAYNVYIQINIGIDTHTHTHTHVHVHTHTRTHKPPVLLLPKSYSRYQEACWADPGTLLSVS